MFNLMLCITYALMTFGSLWGGFKLLKQIQSPSRSTVPDSNEHDDRPGRRQIPESPLGMFMTKGTVYAILFIAGITGSMYMSAITVGGDNVGLLTRTFGGSSMEPGQYIARDDQNGHQANILGPGFHFKVWWRAFYNINEEAALTVPTGKYAILVAADGAPLRRGQFTADEWPEAEVEKMLNVEYFMGFDKQDGKPRGQKGPQLTVVKPGKYLINSRFFHSRLAKAEVVETGEVAVVRSSVQTVSDQVCQTASIKIHKDSDISTPIVPRGCIGVWDTALSPQNYYLNSDAYSIIHIPTRATPVWYKGGYKKRNINLEVEHDGTITQTPSDWETVPIPDSAVDGAILVRVEGWSVPVEFRLTVQVSPEEAPVVVATLGDLKKVVDTILTPVIRDELRSIGGQVGQNCTTTMVPNTNPKVTPTTIETCEIPATRVMDFIEKRDIISARVKKAIEGPAARAGVKIVEARMGEVAVPPELLTASLRQQLAIQLQGTYVQEKLAQEKRIAVEEQRATAEQQPELIKALIAKQAAEYNKLKRIIDGEADKAFLTLVAEGQQKQAAVLGQDRVLQLEIAKLTINAATANPEIVKVPNVLVTGSVPGSFEGPAAILGNSNLSQQLLRQVAPTKEE